MDPLEADLMGRTSHKKRSDHVVMNPRPVLNLPLTGHAELGPLQPDGMSEAARVIWQQLAVTGEFQRLTRSHSNLLASYCEHENLRRSALAELSQPIHLDGVDNVHTAQDRRLRNVSRQTNEVAKLGARLGFEPGRYTPANTVQQRPKFYGLLAVPGAPGFEELMAERAKDGMED